MSKRTLSIPRSPMLLPIDLCLTFDLLACRGNMSAPGARGGCQMADDPHDIFRRHPEGGKKVINLIFGVGWRVREVDVGCILVRASWGPRGLVRTCLLGHHRIILQE